MTLASYPQKRVARPSNDVDLLIEGTTVEVHRIGALFGGGLTMEEVMEAYPSLTARQIEEARAYSIAYPLIDNPYPDTSFTKLLKSGALRHLKGLLAEAEKDE
jgi:hypothetical protein